MSQGMMRIDVGTAPKPKTTAHLLPCRVHYDGLVDPAQSYWSPSQKDDGTKTAYFRGRKLHGRTVKLPEGYRGVVVEKQPPPPATTEPKHDMGDTVSEQAEELVPLGSLETKADFDEFVVWGHEVMADATSDPFARMEEWTKLAEQIHSYPPVEEKS